MLLIGIILTVLAYMVSLFISKKIKISFLNPILVASLIIIGVIHWTPLQYETYAEGGAYIVKILGPLVVVLAVPLYNNKHILKKYYKPISIGVLTGVISSAFSVVVLSWLMGLDMDIMLSLLPKSITSPMAIEVSEIIGGIKELTVVFVVITGMFGASVGPLVFDIFRIKNDTARGMALGAGAHGVGTAKAVEISEQAGAASSLSMILCGVTTIILSVVLMKIV
ncbi:MAG: LrgB family protein [Clostridiales bacterium 38_11]|nr:MAG: LrgB family protein [Clostridiales bacterium 38_11]HBH12020.1 LrgB family protein [Clostridiales bacterium]